MIQDTSTDLSQPPPGPGPPLHWPEAAWGGAAAMFCAAAAGLYWLLPELAALGSLFALFALVALAGLIRSAGRRARSGEVAGILLGAAEGSPEAQLIATAQGDTLYANPAFRRLLAPPAAIDALAAMVDDAGDEGGGADPAGELARLRAAAGTGVAQHADVPLRRPSGALEWWRISASPLSGTPGHVLWRAEDVTARRELETVRRGEEEMLADLLDHLPVGFFSADGDGRILYANQTLGGWLGVAAGDLSSAGRSFADFVVATGSAPNGGTGAPDSNGEVTLRREGGGTFRACLVQSQRLDEDGDFAYSRSLLIRPLALGGDGGGSWEESERRLHGLFDEAPVGVVMLDLDGAVRDCNRAFLKLLGLHRDAVVGQPFAERLSKEDRGDVGGQLSKVVMGAARAAHLEVTMPGAGQRQLAASLFASPMEGPEGEVSGLILHFIDTTEHKHLEVQFAQSQKMQAVGQLAGGVAHDFNNLLTAMIGFCDLLLERHDLADPSFADIMQIKQNANRATNLVRQLLAFSRKQTLQPEVLAITESMSELSNLLGRLIGENIELKMEHQPGLGLVRVDRGQFDQVIINLVVNARDAMPGGGTLTIRTSNVDVAAPVQRGHELIEAGSYVLIEVTDTGVGIAKENIERVFEPFFTTKEVGAGTGLGLSTVYGIIHQTGGYITFDSAPGEGTTFSIFLPRHADDAAAGEGVPETAGAPEAAPAGDLTGVGTVLLVEDEDAVRMFGGRALRNKGYRVIEAIDGESALDAVNSSETPIDLIISDVVMPGMDGHTLVRLVRQEHPAVKVILMSGYAEEVFAGDIEHDPTIHFLPKPFSLKGLAGKVKEVMES